MKELTKSCIYVWIFETEEISHGVMFHGMSMSRYKSLFPISGIMNSWLQFYILLLDTKLFKKMYMTFW